MALVRFEPWREIERFFDDTPFVPANIGWDLAVDVYDQDNNVIAKMNLPGIDPNKLELSFEDAMHLKVSGAREETQETKDTNYYTKEIRHGSFERLIRLPTQVDQPATTADYADGVLTITMPKKKAAIIEKIKVNVKQK